MVLARQKGDKARQKLQPLFRFWRAIILSFFLVLFWQNIAYGWDPWYEDMAGHWAYEYVRVLWEERVTDGYYPAPRTNQYKPNEPMRRDAWLVLLARVFQLSPVDTKHYIDIAPTHQLSNGRQVGGYLQAAGKESFYISDDGRLDPGLPLSRQQAVTGLVKGLGLTDYALSLPPEEINALLRPFSDAHQLQANLRPYVAAAVKLHIVEGYPDGTLRPLVKLTRAEASAVVARSALIQVQARPNPFTPDDDGYEDETVFTLRGLRNRNARHWQLIVTDPNGNIVWETEAMTTPLPVQIPWDGRHLNGMELPAGTYYYQAFLTDNKGQEHQSARMPLELFYRRITAMVMPFQVYPGHIFQVTAYATGDINHVYFFWDGGQADLIPQGIYWEATSRVPLGMPPGDYILTVTGVYPKTTRQVMLLLQVLPDPNPPEDPKPDPPPGDAHVHIVLTD